MLVFCASGEAAGGERGGGGQDNGILNGTHTSRSSIYVQQCACVNRALYSFPSEHTYLKTKCLLAYEVHGSICPNACHILRHLVLVVTMSHAVFGE